MVLLICVGVIFGNIGIIFRKLECEKMKVCSVCGIESTCYRYKWEFEWYCIDCWFKKLEKGEVLERKGNVSK